MKICSVFTVIGAAILLGGCSFSSAVKWDKPDERWAIAEQNFAAIDKRLKGVAQVLKAHDDRLEVLLPTKKVAAK